jgi:Raf kinase inhibitor-like YbhB/YbcL family protein
MQTIPRWSLSAALVGYSLLQPQQAARAEGERKMQEPLQVTSTAFANGELITPQYTCDSTNRAPPLHWSGQPQATASFALLCEDPDAPRGLFTHWIVYQLPPATSQLAEGAGTTSELPQGTLQGKNDFGKLGYGGPCPPSGTHRYFFKVYALDRALQLAAGATRTQLLQAMKGHILAEGQLMGRYQRSGGGK